MIQILQKIYIAILNPIFRLLRPIPTKTKNVIIYGCFFAMMVLYLVWRSYPVIEADINPDFRWKAIMISVLCFVVIVMSIKEELKPVPWNRLAFFFFFGYILIMIGTSFLHPIGDGYLEMLTISFFGFPCLYFVWHNRGDYETLYKLVSLAFSHVFLLYLLILILFYPIDTFSEYGRYVGTLANPNMLGQFCITASTCAFYLIFAKRKNCQLLYLLIGLIAFYLPKTESSVSLLVFFTQILFFGMCVILYMIGKKIKTGEGIRILASMGIVIFLFAAVAPYGIGQIETAYAVEEVAGQETVQEEANQSIIYHPAFMKLNQLTSGRLVIWKCYVENLNLFGHDGREHLYVHYISGYHWAHNTVLEYAYRSGFFAGLLYLALEIYSIVVIGQGFFSNNKYKKWYVFSLMVLILYMISATMEVTVFFYNSPPTLLFLIAIMPIFSQKIRREQENFS